MRAACLLGCPLSRKVRESDDALCQGPKHEVIIGCRANFKQASRLASSVAVWLFAPANRDVRNDTNVSKLKRKKECDGKVRVYVTARGVRSLKKVYVSLRMSRAGRNDGCSVVESGGARVRGGGRALLRNGISS